MQNCDESFIQVTIWVDILFKYDVDILNIDRIKQWKDKWLRIIPMLKLYYMKNNPNYQNEI